MALPAFVPARPTVGIACAQTECSDNTLRAVCVDEVRNVPDEDGSVFALAYGKLEVRMIEP
jgi:hypothetical protein